MSDEEINQNQNRTLSLNQVFNAEGKSLKNKVFRIITRGQNGRVKLKRYVQLLVKKFYIDDEEQKLLQIIDISKSVLYNKAKAKSEVMALMNATVSHEMRNPLNSILNQCAQFRFQLSQLKSFVDKFDQTYKHVRNLKDAKAIIRALDGLKVVPELRDFH